MVPARALAGQAPRVAHTRGRQAPPALLTLDPGQRAVIIGFSVAVAAAVLAPYPPTKYLIGASLALYWATLLANFDERFVGLYVLLLPTFQLLPLEMLGIPGLNWQTVFLVIFLLAAATAERPSTPMAITGWLTYFAVLLTLTAAYTLLTTPHPVWPLFTLLKNWLFPFSLFVLGRRAFRSDRQLWYLVFCVALISLAMSLHGLRDGLSTGSLLTNRPTGMLTGQANLFAGYLAMYAVLFLFVSRSDELGRTERRFLLATAGAMVMTMVFTLSRGAWLAFMLTIVLVGMMASRRLVIVLVLAVLVAYRYAPEEAVSRAEMTVEALQESADSSLEEAFDDSAALRILQWQTFPELFMTSPLWGTGLDTYAQQLGRVTGIYRSAHATVIQIGTEMGLLGLVGYAGLLGAAALACAARARGARRGSFRWAIGLGLLAATVCLALLDITGTRFRTHTVMTYYWLLLGAYFGSTDRVMAPRKVRAS